MVEADRRSGEVWWCDSLAFNEMKKYLEMHVEPKGWRRWAVISFALLLCLLILARYEINNGFSVLPGDRYDAVISATILEHWFNVFLGHADWLQVKYFYPHARTIAQTDAYLLPGIAYIPFRLSGFDPFLAQSFAGFALKSVGFGGMYLFCRRTLTIPFGWSVVAAVLFTLSNGMTNHSSRIQVASIAFAPVLGWLLWCAALKLWQDNGRHFMYFGGAAGVLFGAWCLSSFYMAWFFAYFTLLFIVSFIFLLGREGLATLAKRLMSHWRALLGVILVAAASLIPFVYAFWVKAQEVGGGRPLEQALKNVVVPEGMLQVGESNLLFGRLYNYIISYVSPGYERIGEYYNTGISPLLFIFFALGAARMFRRNAVVAKAPWRALVIATLVSWFSVVDWWGFVPWVYVYQWIPGAAALNVVSAYQIFVAFPVVAIATKYLSCVRMGPAIAMVISGLLFAGELNVAYTNLHRQDELQRISVEDPRSLGCEAFYVSGWVGQDGISPAGEWANNVYAHNVTAMLVAQMVNIPTLNGMASFNPPDWVFGYPWRPDYEERVAQYARKYGIESLCRLDLNTKEWRRVVLNSSGRGGSVRLEELGKGSGVFAANAFPGEAWGVWFGAGGRLKFKDELSGPVEIVLWIKGFGPNVGRTVRGVIGEERVEFVMPPELSPITLKFSGRARGELLEFEGVEALSPASLGDSSDDRRLAFAISKVEINAK